ncbi:MAG TPA: DUF6483 family protein [Clostridia bacterium]|nr:DUF6483 family protein [Clostridia bacterium]
MIRQDWIMRQIEALIQFVARLIFKKDAIAYEIADPQSLGETDLLHRRLLELIAQNDFCAAEDLLHREYASDDEGHILLALDFYQRLNDIDDGRLEAHDFSREEIHDGLRDILRRSGIDLDA